MIDTEIDKRELNPGDIIVYRLSNRSKNIVHRIIKVRGNGYMTRGDNNRTPDDYIVKFDSVIGKVLSVKRGTKTIRISGERAGLLLHRKLTIRKTVIRFFLKVPVLISRMIDKSKILTLFHPLIKADVILIKRGNSSSEILVYKNGLIGKKCMNSGGWEIRFPYKYFINKEKL